MSSSPASPATSKAPCNSMAQELQAKPQQPDAHAQHEAAHGLQSHAQLSTPVKDACTSSCNGLEQPCKANVTSFHIACSGQDTNTQVVSHESQHHTWMAAAHSCYFGFPDPMMESECQRYIVQQALPMARTWCLIMMSMLTVMTGRTLTTGHSVEMAHCFMAILVVYAIGTALFTQVCETRA